VERNLAISNPNHTKETSPKSTKHPFQVSPHQNTHPRTKMGILEEKPEDVDIRVDQPKPFGPDALNEMSMDEFLSEGFLKTLENAEEEMKEESQRVDEETVQITKSKKKKVEKEDEEENEEVMEIENGEESENEDSESEVEDQDEAQFYKELQSLQGGDQADFFEFLKEQDPSLLKVPEKKEKSEEKAVLSEEEYKSLKEIGMKSVRQFFFFFLSYLFFLAIQTSNSWSSCCLSCCCEFDGSRER